MNQLLDYAYANLDTLQLFTATKEGYEQLTFVLLPYGVVQLVETKETVSVYFQFSGEAVCTIQMSSADFEAKEDWVLERVRTFHNEVLATSKAVSRFLDTTMRKG